MACTDFGVIADLKRVRIKLNGCHVTVKQNLKRFGKIDVSAGKVESCHYKQNLRWVSAKTR